MTSTALPGRSRSSPVSGDLPVILYTTEAWAFPRGASREDDSTTRGPLAPADIVRTRDEKCSFRRRFRFDIASGAYEPDRLLPDCSAYKGVMFITLKDETSIANLVIWPKLYEENRRTILGALMLGVHGRIQREGEVVHLVAYKLFDLSDQLASVGGRDAPLKLRQGRGDEFAHGWSPDARDAPPKGMAARDIYIPDLHIDSIKPKTRDFR